MPTELPKVGRTGRGPGPCYGADQCVPREADAGVGMARDKAAEAAEISEQLIRARARSNSLPRRRTNAANPCVCLAESRRQLCRSFTLAFAKCGRAT